MNTKELSCQVRRDLIDMTYKVGVYGTHIGGSLSAVEIMSVLYNDIMKISKETVRNQLRDRFILSKGHGAMALYAVLYRIGVLSKEDIDSFKENGSAFSNHPSMNLDKGIEVSSGSLGLGLSIGVGVALSLKLAGNYNSKVYVYQGDGECDEGSVWEAAMSAAHYKLDNIILIIDRNGLQLDGSTEDVMNQYSLNSKFDSFGFTVYEVDGHDIEAIKKVFDDARRNQVGPVVIIANTVKGKGVSFIENRYDWHIGALNDKTYQQAIDELNKQ